VEGALSPLQSKSLRRKVHWVWVEQPVEGATILGIPQVLNCLKFTPAA
jgi:hypothetical protein